MKKIILFMLIFGFFAVPVFSQSYEGRITRIDGDKVRVNWGSDDGVLAGMMLDIVKRKRLVHPSTGEILRIEKENLGKIRLQKVQSDYSEGVITKSSGNPNVGDMVEIDLTAPIINDGASQNNEAKVTGINGDIVTINVGTKDGVEKGLIFDVESGNAVRNPATGQIVAGGSGKVAKIMVIGVEENTSMCRLFSGSGLKVNDRIVLAGQQQSDMNLERQTMPAVNRTTQPQANYTQPDFNQTSFTQAERKDERGIVANTDGGRVFINWNRNESFDAGKELEIYRRERMVHPVTGADLGSPYVKIGKVRLTESLSRVAYAEILSNDTDIRQNDIVCLDFEAVPETVTQEASRKNTTRPDKKPASPVKRAKSLAEQINEIQKDMKYIRRLINKVNSVEKGLASQKKATDQLTKDVELIKEILQGNLPSGTLTRGEGADVELGMLGGTERIIRVGEGVNVKLQFNGRNIDISMETDSSLAAYPGASGDDMTPGDNASGEGDTLQSNDGQAQDDSKPGQNESGSEDQDKPENGSSGKPKINTSSEGQDYSIIKKSVSSSFLLWLVGGVTALALAGGVFTFLKKRKGGGKKKKSKKEADDSDAGLDDDELDVDEELDDIEEEDLEFDEENL